MMEGATPLLAAALQGHTQAGQQLSQPYSALLSGFNAVEFVIQGAPIASPGPDAGCRSSSSVAPLAFSLEPS